MRAFAAQLVDAASIVGRQALDRNLKELSQAERKLLNKAGIVVGTLDIYHPAMLKPEASRIRLALQAAQHGNPMPLLPAKGATVIRRPTPELAAGARKAGYRAFGPQMVRIDLVERVSRMLHEQRGSQNAFAPQDIAGVGLGLDDATLRRVFRELGFFPSDPASPELWRWRSPIRQRRAAQTPNPTFEALREWNKGTAH